MSPEEYERFVAELLRVEGWQAEPTSYMRDFGIDVIAERDGIRLGVQAKMFAGANRVVGSPDVLQTYGAAAYADCAQAMIATDSELSPDALKVATKLSIEIRHIPVPQRSATPPKAGGELTFGGVWQEHIVPLAGRTLLREDGKTNQIIEVNGGGIVRLTSNGKQQPIKIEVFRWTIERLLRGETVTRADINTNCVGRASSGVVLILSQVPLFEAFQSDCGIALRLKHPAPHAGLAGGGA
jgi:restriction system protein